LDQRFISVKQCSEFLGVSTSAIRLWVREQRLRCVRVGGRVLIDREYLEARAASGQLLEPTCQSERTETQTDAR
jgi:excisionase family DNA binding protein